jgi:hypothetical protein
MLSHPILYPTQCPSCGHHYKAVFWILVDLRHSPGLVRRIIDRSIWTQQCPKCEADAGKIDTPILLFPDGENPPTIYSPPAQAQSKDPKQRLEYIDLFRQSLGENWKEEWITRGSIMVDRDHLGEVVEGLMQKFDPSRAWEKEAAKPVPTIPMHHGLHGQLVALLDAPTRDDAIRILAAFPELLTAKADEFFQRFIDAAEAVGDQTNAEHIRLTRNMVRTLRDRDAERGWGLVPDQELDKSVLKYLDFLPEDARQVVSDLLDRGFKLVLSSDIAAAETGQSGPNAHATNHDPHGTPVFGEAMYRALSVNGLLKFTSSKTIYDAAIDLLQKALLFPGGDQR